MKRRRLKESLEAEFYSKPSRVEHRKRKIHDHAADPSTEASLDPAPTEHTVDNGELKSREGDKYLPNKPYRTKKGDRFS